MVGSRASLLSATRPQDFPDSSSGSKGPYIDVLNPLADGLRGGGQPNDFQSKVALLDSLAVPSSASSNAPRSMTESYGTSNSAASFLREDEKKAGLRKGKTKIVDKDGNGSPTEDTVPAMLAEGEAVLNAGAAELMGRDQIRELNKRGLRVMGLPEDSQPEVKSDERPGYKYGLARVMTMKDPVGYMCGTSNVKKGKVGYMSGTEYVKKDGLRVHAAVGWEDVKNVAGKAMDLARDVGGRAADFVRPAGTSAPEAPAAPRGPASPLDLSGGKPIYVTPSGAASVDPNVGMFEKTAEARTAAARGPLYGAGQTVGSTVRSAADATRAAIGESMPKSMLGKGLAAIGAPLAALDVASESGVLGGPQAERTAAFYNDPNVPFVDKAGQAVRTAVRTAAPYVGATLGSVVPVKGTIAGGVAGMGVRGMIDEEGQALREYNARNPARPAGGTGFPGETVLGGEPARLFASREDAARAGVVERAQSPVSNQPAQPRTIRIPVSALGGYASYLNAITPKEKEGRMPEGTIVNPVTGKKDDFLTAQFNEEFLPRFAAQIGVRANNLKPEQMSAAKANFNVLQQANRAGLESGKGFNLSSPISNFEWVEDLPAFTSGRRGENTMWQGIRDDIPFTDKGGLRVTSGGQTQIIPASMIDYSDPFLSDIIERAKKQKK
jgi:hypothetical protein